MGETLDITRLLQLRKATRRIAEFVADDVKGHLLTLAPLLQPAAIFGRHASKTSKQSVRGENDAFDELKSLYQGLADEGRLAVSKEPLESPLNFHQVTPEITPLQYNYEAGSGAGRKEIVVIAPLRFSLCFHGYSIERLKQLISRRDVVQANDIRQCVVHLLAVHIAVARRPGVAKILEAMRWHVTSLPIPDLGDLPTTQIKSPVPTILPDDEIVIQSTEIAGTTTFEEVVDPQAIESLEDPLKERLLQEIQ